MSTFDICLMNPPYDKNLHLKFLSKMIKTAGTVVSVQPCEFILRPYAKKNWKTLKDKYKDSIGNHIEDLSVIDKNDALDMFDAKIDIDLGIYVCSDKGGLDYDNFYKRFDIDFLKNIEKFNTEYSLKDKIEKYDNQMYFVPIRKDGNLDRWWCCQLTNYLDVIENGKVYSGKYKGFTISEARRQNPKENPRNIDRDTIGISFETIEQALNFRDMTKLDAYIYIIAMMKITRSNPLDRIPYLNPNIKWTNEKIFDFFGIDKDKQTKIIDIVKPLTEATKKFGGKFEEIKKELLGL